MSTLADTLQLLIGIEQKHDLSSICTAKVHLLDSTMVVCN